MIRELPVAPLTLVMSGMLPLDAQELTEPPERGHKIELGPTST